MKLLIQLIAVLLFCSSVFATTVVNENFDSQSSAAVLGVYDEGRAITYSTEQRMGGSGYSIKGNHANGDLIIRDLDIETHSVEGVYLRYWVFYDSNYLWPGDGGVFENHKLLKFASSAAGWDIEFIYKNSTGGGPTYLNMYWFGEDGTTTGNGTESTTLGSRLEKEAWHKIEVYIKIGTAYADQAIHVQIDDYDVYNDSGTSVNFRLPASAYTGTQHIAAERVSNSPPAGQGYYYFDDVIIVHNEGDLCDNEPGGTPEASAGLTGSTTGAIR